MLVIFKCKAAGDIIMFEENAKPILDALGKDVEQGIILAAETAAAIQTLETEIARMKIVEAEEKARREAEALEKELERQKKREQGIEEEEGKDDGRGERVKPAEPVSFAARAFP
ncbi:MAG: DUF1840 family protein, partial [Burkholderiaceae bacterium]|nr:DUF1840 family protein [Burkholderiaceae bacterium]